MPGLGPRRGIEITWYRFGRWGQCTAPSSDSGPISAISTAASEASLRASRWPRSGVNAPLSVASRSTPPLIPLLWSYPLISIFSPSHFVPPAALPAPPPVPVCSGVWPHYLLSLLQLGGYPSPPVLNWCCAKRGSKFMTGTHPQILRHKVIPQERCT